MSEPKYVCVDLDGTIAHYQGWQGETHFGEPVEGVQEALGRLKTAGWQIIIFTTRGNSKLVADYLNSHSIPFDCINQNPDQPENTFRGKPYAEAYIDDRGIQFNGNWQATVDEVLHFQPWELRSGPNQSEEYKKEAINFIGRDYAEVFQQMRKYDDEIWDITKFSFLQLVGSIGATWAIFSLAYSKDADPLLGTLWEVVGAMILLISFLFGLLAVQFILRIRVYFVVTARYINEQRGFFLSSRPVGLSNRSGFYMNRYYPKAFDPGSTHLLAVYIISLICSLLFGLGIGLMLHYFGMAIVRATLTGIVAWMLMSLLSIGYGIYYLRSKRDRSTDYDVFGVQKTD